VSSYNVLRTAVDRGVRRIVQASSVNAHGLSFAPEGHTRFERFPITEEVERRPVSAIAILPLHAPLQPPATPPTPPPRPRPTPPPHPARRSAPRLALTPRKTRTRPRRSSARSRPTLSSAGRRARASPPSARTW
jgi:type IV secretory pathway VirB10-like protein